MELSAAQIAEFLGGRPLYKWQRRLLEEWFCVGCTPDALDLPTGLGKTSVIWLWLAARAIGANLPRRLIYVVDRRAVVDQATAVADMIAERLGPSAAAGPATQIRAALGLSGEESLPISTLRGQHLDNRRWLEDPASSAIVVGTVDMIGSRLLFEGYGVSRKMRPVHAGLIGVDSLIVLDEAHLVPPFEALVRQVSTLGRGDANRAPHPLARSIHLMSLSATGRETPGASVFRLIEDDLDDPPVRARLESPKRLRVLPEASPNDIVRKLADEAWTFGEGGRRVVVFCNSRKTAQAVEADIANRISKDKARFGKDAHLTALLVGERRYRERLRLAGDGTPNHPGSWAFNRFRPGESSDPSGRPAFLVATSAGEVGVDLDADDMVCDLLAWERMVQRLGRVNRRPIPGEARVTVIPVMKEKEAEDNIEDTDLARYRAPFDNSFWPEGEDGAKDASPIALARLREIPEIKEVLADASTPEPLRPLLTRATVEAWSMTSLDTHPGRPKVQPWIRGWVETEPQTTMVWRRLFPLPGGEEPVMRDLKAFFEAAPPHVSESLQAPTWRVVEVLRKRADAWRKAGFKVGSVVKDGAELDAEATDVPDADVREAPEADARAEPKPAFAPVVVLIGPDGDVEDVYSIARLAEANADALGRALANGTVVVDARMGGLDRNGLLDVKASVEPDTIDMQQLGGWGLGLERSTGWRVIFGERPMREGSRHDGSWRLDEFRWAASDADDAEGLWVELWRGPGHNLGDPAVSGRSRSLGDHHDDTGGHAMRIADSIGLDSPYRELLIAAARAHDLGKDRKLWQDAMGAGLDGRPWAKTLGGGDGRALNGYRHEFGSLRDVTNGEGSGLLALFKPGGEFDDPGLHDLALHLVATHHGWLRPVIKAYDPHLDEPPSRSLPRAREAALRFARLQATWGPWGLAWWEALLRAADWAASRGLNDAATAPIQFPQASETPRG
ncbi:MAG: type I-U CRISPR-associated helicase/endonuclease Cas3 [Caulobacteraceae bacterium]|nr:type I-U CRISPR-associated helicase/endonuclease Cas3 [Caulobacteraceae bacterium]